MQLCGMKVEAGEEATPYVDDTTNMVALTGQWNVNTYTINYYVGNGTDTPGNTLLGTSTATYGASTTLTTFANLGGIFPHSSEDKTLYTVDISYIRLFEFRICVFSKSIL